MRLLARVGPLMPQNGALVAEPAGARRAGARLLAGVGPLVWRNVALVAEPTGGHRAGVRLLARVGLLVPPSGRGEPPRGLLCKRVAVAIGALVAKRIGHVEQACGFSPMWVRSCCTTWPFSANRTRKNGTPRPPGLSLGFPPLPVGGACRTWGLRCSTCGARRASARLLARVGPLVPGNGALFGEPLQKINASAGLRPARNSIPV